MYVCLGKHTYRDKKRHACMYAWSKGTYLPSMYVCPGKHTYLENDRNVWYVCMSGETYITRQEEVCMYVCMVQTYIPQKHGYVCFWETWKSHSYPVCMSRETYIHT